MKDFPTTIAVPCYNEAARLDTAAFLRFAGTAESVRFVMVDDGSTDAAHGVLGVGRDHSENHACVQEVAQQHGEDGEERPSYKSAITARPAKPSWSG